MSPSIRAPLPALLAAATLLASCGRASMPESLDGKLSQAVQELSLYSFDSAHPLFAAAMAQAPEGSDPWQQAVYGTALCRQHMMPASEATIGEAESLYRKLLEKTPQSKYAPRALLNLGRIAELPDYYGDRPDRPKARTYYQKVIDTWPTDEIAGEATLRLAATYVQTFDEPQVRQGTAILAKWLADHPTDPLASAMWQYLGDTYFFPLADYRPALDAYLHADQLGWMNESRRGQAYWRIANIADKRLSPPDKPLAIRFYTRIITDTPTCGKAYEAQLALKRLGIPNPPPIRLTAATTQEAAHD